MKISEETRNDIAIIHLEGKVMGGPDAAKFHEKVHDFIESGVKNVVVDLAKVEWMSSVGLGMLISALTTIKNSGGQLRLANITDNIESLLTITRLVTIFEACDTLEDALGSF
jgi:anti-sigma B factor antagonist